MRRPKRLPRGIFFRNGWYWIRYVDQHGRLHREKGSPLLEGAKDALAKRRTEIRELKFFPEKIKQRSVLFREIAKDYTDHIKQVKRDWAHDEARVKILLGLMKDVSIAELTPGRLETVLAQLGKKNSWADATHNRYRALLSGIFRRAVKNGKASANPVRETVHRKENNRRVRPSLSGLTRPLYSTELIRPNGSGRRSSRRRSRTFTGTTCGIPLPRASRWREYRCDTSPN